MHKRIIVKIITVIILCIASSAISEAGTYYVSPTGAATWAACANINTPCSWQTAMATAVADDIVYFRGGTYNVPDITPPDSYEPLMHPANSGTSGHPITFIAYPTEIPYISCSLNWATIGTFNNDWIIWDGFKLQMNRTTGVSKIFEIFGSNNITIRNSEMIGVPHRDHQNTSGIQIDQSSYIYIYNNKFHGMSKDPNPIEPAVNTGAVWFMGYNHCYFYNNEVYDNDMGFMTKLDPSYIYIYNNFFHDMGAAYYHLVTVGASPAIDYYFYQNVAVNVGGLVNAPDTTGVNTNLNIYNNTTYNSTGSAIQIGTNSYHNTRSAKIYNNIFYFTSGTPAFLMYNSGIDLPDYSNYNLFYGSGNWRWDYFTTISSLASWRTATGFDTNSITSNPLFVNAGGTRPEDYMLANGSPAKGTGRNGTDMGAFLNGYATRIGYRSPARPSAPQNLQ